VMEPRWPRRRLCRPSPWRRPGATLDAGRWCGPTLSNLLTTGPRVPEHQPIPPCPQASHPSGILNQDHPPRHRQPLPSQGDGSGLKVTKRV